MLKAIHARITRQALTGRVSPRALDGIVAANLGQDRLGGQIGHDEYHFDNNAFARGRAYIEAQHALIGPALAARDRDSAWRAFGRLTHAAQDFYAHSNYVDLLLSGRLQKATPPAEVDPLDPELIEHPALRSGRIYYPLEAFSFVPGLKRLVVPLLPRDSHAWMNLDSPERGALFEYAFQAATKRTVREFEAVRKALAPESFELFRDTIAS